MLLAHIVDTLTFLLLNKNPTTSELLSYRRKENDSLRRFFLDKTNYISNSIKLLDKSLKLAAVEIKERTSAKTNDSKGMVKDKTVKKLKTKNPKKIIKDKTTTKSTIINVKED